MTEISEDDWLAQQAGPTESIGDTPALTQREQMLWEATLVAITALPHMGCGADLDLGDTGIAAVQIAQATLAAFDAARKEGRG